MSTLHCVYCGRYARLRHGQASVCYSHMDLPRLDPHYMRAPELLPPARNGGRRVVA